MACELMVSDGMMSGWHGTWVAMMYGMRAMADWICTTVFQSKRM